ncbi:hypothetical protein K505DRAFT_26162 [Melanomma pulvis-pyrius CBS 109.77]|uniref:Uncharacterized protein n=1 Tax=Melanomma pulvis-pyrius CBS 109.77 TaxID=1314802 RepID=A0A6A6XDV8_9PLEO|nr:hypothetical protein K505DRAFT_26162 [Melanomma pulvis-pyrius CBS 109.77]
MKEERRWLRVKKWARAETTPNLPFTRVHHRSTHLSSHSSITAPSTPRRLITRFHLPTPAVSSVQDSGHSSLLDLKLEVHSRPNGKLEGQRRRPGRYYSAPISFLSGCIVCPSLVTGCDGAKAGEMERPKRKSIELITMDIVIGCREACDTSRAVRKVKGGSACNES